MHGWLVGEKLVRIVSDTDLPERISEFFIFKNIVAPLRLNKFSTREQIPQRTSSGAYIRVLKGFCLSRWRVIATGFAR